MKKAIAAAILSAALFLFPGCAPDDYIVIPLFEFNTAPVQWDDSAATVFLGIAAVCMECDRDPDVNRAAMEQYIETIKGDHPDVRLVLFSETNLGWYLDPDDPSGYQKGIAESGDGPTMTLMKQAAVGNDVYVGYGYTESADDVVYNSFALINPDGELIANHRKVYLAPTMDDVNGFTAGDTGTTAVVDGIKVALQICRDLSSEALAAEYAGDPDIKIILAPLADLNDNPALFANLRLRNKWVVFANRIGTEGDAVYPGWYGFYDPTGFPVLSSVGKSGYLFLSVGVAE